MIVLMTTAVLTAILQTDHGIKLNSLYYWALGPGNLQLPLVSETSMMGSCLVVCT